MQYFTQRGSEKVRNHYNSLLGKEFYFRKDRGKQKLLKIERQLSRVDGGYFVNFRAENNQIAQFNDFLQLNGFPNDFDNYEQISVQLSI